MPIVSQTFQFVIGVDTHAKTHTLAILAADGHHVGTAQFPTSPPGMNRALAWVAHRTGGVDATLFSIEGIGAYGAMLAHQVMITGYQVVEAPHMDKKAHHGVGKSDPIDSLMIAHATLPLDITRLRQPRDDNGIRVGLRVLADARVDMNKQRTTHINQLIALVRTINLGIDARSGLTKTQIKQITTWQIRDEPIEAHIARLEATRLATSITSLDNERADNQKNIMSLLKQTKAAPLLDKCGIGPITLANILIPWSHPGRVRSEAAFAALAGVNPIPASSGNTTRHRLNHGGDRRLNNALHTIALTRTRFDPETRDYITRRTTQGRTDKEIRRCLKRYLARQIYRALQDLYNPPATI